MRRLPAERPLASPPSSPSNVEGDLNLSERRRAWQAKHLAAETIDQLAADGEVFLHQSLSTPCLNVVGSCQGAELVDLEGRRILDFHGNSVHQVGYGHPRVVEAIERQLHTLPFCPRRYANRTATALARRLIDLTPPGLDKVLFAPGGTTAIGIALKIIRYATGRYKTISMNGAFHGASLDAISIGGEDLFRDGVGPLLPGCFHVPRPTCHDPLAAAIDPMEAIMDREHDIGAVIAEPIRATTIDRPPSGYWQAVRGLCDAYGALLVFDEIPMALGRTGRMFCCQHFGVVPDILVLGKGLGGGMLPMAAVLARGELDVAGDRAIGHYTHEKSPLGAAAALATLDVIESEGLIERSRQEGRYALEQLDQLRSRIPWVVDVRGIGLAIAVELRREAAHGSDVAERVLYTCLDRGLSFKVSDGNVLTLMPPLTINRRQLDRAIGIVSTSLLEIDRS